MGGVRSFKRTLFKNMTQYKTQKYKDTGKNVPLSFVMNYVKIKVEKSLVTKQRTKTFSFWNWFLSLFTWMIKNDYRKTKRISA